MNYKTKKFNRINRASEGIILEYMMEWIDNGRPNRKPFAILSTKIPHTPKQICHHWTNKLDPRLCLSKKTPFSDNEKEYIFKWVKQHLKTSKKKVPWKVLQSKILEEFGKFRARNDIKNLWNLNRKKLDKQAKSLSSSLLLLSIYFMSQ
ncbi:unnamed protein product [Rhizophagus irregularis]|nr:unnamed protein product [Rhizophagus irregularis]CAB5355213.1 unnamed protein product [Rhizophagus irregularis]